MSDITRRRLVRGGLAAAAGASGLAVAARLADRYGLIPPDHGNLYGAGDSLTYAAQRLLTRHSMAREFPRSSISKTPFVNGPPPNDEAFRKLQARGPLLILWPISGAFPRAARSPISHARRAGLTSPSGPASRWLISSA